MKTEIAIWGAMIILLMIGLIIPINPERAGMILCGVVLLLSIAFMARMCSRR